MTDFTSLVQNVCTAQFRAGQTENIKDTEEGILCIAVAEMAKKEVLDAMTNAAKRISALEYENRRLNREIDEILSGRDDHFY